MKKALHSDAIWYAVMAGPRMEFVAADYLKREQIRSWVPFERVTKWRKVWGKAKLEVRRMPLFPRYLFVRIAPGDIARVNDCVGVSTVVYQGEYPVAIPQLVMDELMARADWLGSVGSKDLTVEAERLKFEAGQRVCVAEGSPFAGFIGTVSVDAGKETKVWLRAFGGQREVSVPPSQLTLVE